MANPSGSIYVVQGKKNSSGSERVYDADADRDLHPGGVVSKRWLMLGGVKLTTIPDKLYEASSGDFLIVAYHKNGNSVLAWWNATKKEGSKVGIFHLIFHTYIMVSVLIGGAMLWYICHGGNFGKETMNRIYGGAAVTIAILYVASYFDWRKSRYAQQRVNEQKNKLN